ncbi:MAG: CoA-transferase [Actinomycetota bacterium]|nr:CoA-transferase [Actinomycetota bacterium]
MNYTPQELIAVSASRLLADRKVVFAGVGMPLLASVLAKSLHAPHLTIVLEGGIIGPKIKPGELPISTNEMRAARGAMMLTDIVDIFLYAQRGFFDYGFLGTAQIDKFGNINTTVIGDFKQPKVRLPGSGGANDIISSCREIFVVTTHQARRFVEEVDFVTSPGYLSGGNSRKESGLIFGRVSKVVTDLGILGFDFERGHMILERLQHGVALDQVQEATGFELPVADQLEHAARPTAKELEVLRTLDPTGAMLGAP